MSRSDYDILRQCIGKDVWVLAQFGGVDDQGYLIPEYVFGLDDAQTYSGYIRVLNIADDDENTVTFNLLSEYAVTDHNINAPSFIDWFYIALEHPMWNAYCVKLPLNHVHIIEPIETFTTEEIEDEVFLCDYDAEEEDE